jgi:hypothetical protein
MITQADVCSAFDYKDGDLYWKDSGAKVGGCVNRGGYKVMGFRNKNYLIHRIVYLMFHGYLPKFIDHVDNDRVNNKLENLRPASPSQNLWNASLRPTNTSGCKGVSWHKKTKKWQVKLSVDRVLKHFGYFDDLELADLVAIEARTKYHGQFARHA